LRFVWIREKIVAALAELYPGEWYLRVVALDEIDLRDSVITTPNQHFV
jgi:hypothetical protein